jgi:hypothetical protein
MEHHMLFDQYESKGLLYNVNFKETVGGLGTYRGDLVLVPGEVADDQGRRKPPVSLVVGAVAVAEGDTLKMLAGSLDDVAQLPQLIENYLPACTPETKLVMYVVNIDKPMTIEVGALRLPLVPMPSGIVWTLLADELTLDKDDFKGQSSGGKVLTVFKAMAGFKPNYPLVTLEQAYAAANGAKRAIYGAI